MTVFDLYRFGLYQLEEKIPDDANMDCAVLFADAFQVDPSWRILHANDQADPTKEKLFLKNIKVRVSGKPLQYILGKWSFYGREFCVGKGVLIPRPETEELVERALEILKPLSQPVVYDLCAGSGAIGLTIAKERSDAKVFLFEKYDAAYAYLEQNKKTLQCQNATIIKADIFDFSWKTIPKADLLLSNPPYIPSSELSGLQMEVQEEPATALNGGEDGLTFYRGILKRWLSAVKSGGNLVFECGNNQAAQIISLFKAKTTKQNIIYDFNKVDRIVEFKV